MCVFLEGIFIYSFVIPIVYMSSFLLFLIFIYLFLKSWHNPTFSKQHAWADWVPGYRQTSRASSMHRQSPTRWQQNSKQGGWFGSCRPDGNTEQGILQDSLPILPTYPYLPPPAGFCTQIGCTGKDLCVNQSYEKKRETIRLSYLADFV